VVPRFKSCFIHQNAMRSMVGERDERAVQAAVSAIDTEINHRMDILRGLASLAKDDFKENLKGFLTDFSYLGDDFDFGMVFFAERRVAGVFKRAQ
jgi:hypothetical protein